MMFTSSSLISGTARFLVLLIVLVLHEYAHAFVAYKNGDNTAKAAGRLTLNPIKHFDIPGLLMMLFLPIAYAKPIPINPYNFRNRRRGYFTTAIAGVTVNLILAVVMALPYALLMQYGGAFLGSGGAFAEFVLYLLFYFVAINLAVLLFNLLPIYPLDGFRVVETITKPKNPYRVFMYESGVLVLMALFVLSVGITMVFQFFPYAPEWINYFDLLGYWLPMLINWLAWLLESMWLLVFRLFGG